MAANIQGSKIAAEVFSEWLWLRNMIAYKKWAYSDLIWLSYDYFNKIQDGCQKSMMAAKNPRWLPNLYYEWSELFAEPGFKIWGKSDVKWLIYGNWRKKSKMAAKKQDGYQSLFKTIIFLCWV